MIVLMLKKYTNYYKKDSGKLIIENKESNDEIAQMKLEKRRMGSAER